MVKKRKVHFNNFITTIEEPLELSEDLHKARKSDWAQRVLDKLRIERLLNPVLENMHKKQLLNCNKQ